MTLPPLQYLGDPTKRMDLGGVVATVTTYAPGQQQPWHNHETPNVSFLLRGSFRDESHQLGEIFPEPLTLVYHPAGEPHRCEAGPQGRVCLNVEPSVKWLTDNHLDSDSIGSYRTQSGGWRALELLRIALGGHPESSDALLEALFTPPEEAAERSSLHRRLDDLLRQDEESQWTLGTLSAELGVHPVYLARAFRSRHGCTLTQYLHQERILRASRQIVEGAQIGTAAISAGFSDQPHFTRLFKAHVGTSPKSLKRTQ